MEHSWQNEENWCENCVEYDYEGECYFLNKICRACIRNPYVQEQAERIFITDSFLIQPPEDLFFSEINPDKRSIGFIIRFGTLKVLEKNINQN